MRVLLTIFVLFALAGIALCDDSNVVVRDVLVSSDLPEGDPLPFAKDAFEDLDASGSTIERIANVLLEHFNERGYPFAQVCLDNLEQIDTGAIDVTMRVVVGPLTHFDSCEVEGVDRQTAA